MKGKICSRASRAASGNLASQISFSAGGTGTTVLGNNLNSKYAQNPRTAQRTSFCTTPDLDVDLRLVLGEYISTRFIFKRMPVPSIRRKSFPFRPCRTLFLAFSWRTNRPRPCDMVVGVPTSLPPSTPRQGNCGGRMPIQGRPTPSLPLTSQGRRRWEGPSLASSHSGTIICMNKTLQVGR